MTLPFDFHTHRLDAPAGAAIISMPREWLLQPHHLELRPGCLCLGVHPVSQLQAAYRAQTRVVFHQR